MLSQYMAADLPPPPDSVAWQEKVSRSFGIHLNDYLGDCTIASYGHAVQAWNAANGRDIIVSDADIMHAYQDACGYVPGKPETDNGGVMLLVANYLRRTGVGGHRIDAYAALDPGHETQIKQAINLFGGVWIGLSLALAQQNQERWHVALAGTDGDPLPGSWGGHAVWVLGYDKDGLWFVTWGGLKRMSWAFWETCCDESYVLFSKDWADADGAPSGFDYAQLAADVARVTA